MNYTCYKKCGFTTDKLNEVYTHYKDEPSHRRPERSTPKQRAYWKAHKRRQKAAKANGHVVGKEVGFHKHLSVVGAKGRKSNMAILKIQLQAAIDESVAKIEKLKFAQQLLEKGRLEA